MKKLFFLVALLSIQACMAKPSYPVLHSHNGRLHEHSLPVDGVSHRHAGGAPGRAVNQGQYRDATRQPGSITSKVEYGKHKPVLAPHKPAPVRTRSNRFSKGDVSCRPGESDCNLCVNNVQAQFKRASNGQISWRKRNWRFTWPQRYAPNGTRPLDIFDGKPAYALGIPDTHIQGFTRTNSSRYPFAGSHSHKSRGGIFVVKQDGKGQWALASLFQTRGRHPSAVHILGKFLVYGEGNQLVFKDLNSPQQKTDYRLKIDKPSFGGGLGLVRLSPGHYLVMTTGPGGQKSRPRYHHYYHLGFKNGHPQQLKYLGQSPSSVPSNWPRGFAFSENMSVITECGTGDIYTIHTSGDEKGVSAISGNGYWRLSRLQSQGGKLSLNPVKAFITKQNMHNCNVRAAATVYANRQHKLKFYCHGYAKDPDGSLFNVLGSSSRNNDKFRFKAGTLY